MRQTGYFLLPAKSRVVFNSRSCVGLLSPLCSSLYQAFAVSSAIGPGRHLHNLQVHHVLLWSLHHRSLSVFGFLLAQKTKFLLCCSKTENQNHVGIIFVRARKSGHCLEQVHNAIYTIIACVHCSSFISSFSQAVYSKLPSLVEIIL